MSSQNYQTKKSDGSSSAKASGSSRSSTSGQRINVKATRILREGPELTGNHHEELWYEALQPVGQGSFGTVFSARLCATQEQVAIKKVLQDRRFKNRELAIMRRMNHPSVVRLLYFFYTCSSRTPDSEVYLQLVMDFVPENVYKQIQYYSSQRQVMPYIYIKLYIYQLFRALNYIHKDNICHRDIKPQNLLCNPQTGVLKLCDFGSAKQLDPSESNVSYICSRYYRAPELILCAVRYTCAIDVWSCGCVLGELLLNQPLFPGETGVDQLVEIIKILGTPSTEQTDDMNPEANRNFHFPIVPSHPWNRVFRNRTPQSALDLANAILEFSPQKRIQSVVALSHPFFDELRLPNQTLPNGAPLPIRELFHLTTNECTTLVTEAKMAWNGGSGKENGNVFESEIFRGLVQQSDILNIPNDQILKTYISYLQGKHQISSTSEYDSANFNLIPAQSSTEKSTPILNVGTTPDTTSNSQNSNQTKSNDQVTKKLAEDSNNSAMKIVAQNGNSQSNGKAL